MALPTVFVVRVYRRPRRNEQLVATIEPVDGSWLKAVGSAADLWATICAPLRTRGRARRTTAGKGKG